MIEWPYQLTCLSLRQGVRKCIEFIIYMFIINEWDKENIQTARLYVFVSWISFDDDDDAEIEHLELSF